MAIAFGTTVTTTLIPMECGECGTVFGISEAKYDRCKDFGEGWHCPNGHSRKFSKPHNSELKQENEHGNLISSRPMLPSERQFRIQATKNIANS